METVEVGGLNIAYERVGSGPALVLLHGYVGDGVTTWRPQLDGLSDAFTVVTWDAPGAGRSDDLPERFGVDGYADCLAGFLERLGLDPAYVAPEMFIDALHPRGFRAMSRASAEDVRDVLPRVGVPTLLIYGDRDVRAPLTVAEALQAAIAGSKLVVLPNVGHVCNIEAPGEFNLTVREFLDPDA